MRLTMSEAFCEWCMERLAEAWDEGYHAGEFNLSVIDNGEDPLYFNPYRGNS